MTTITNRRSLIIYLGAIIAIAVFANLVSQRLFFRWDLTMNKVYTLSESSRNLISKLDDRLVARVYFSDDLPGDLANSRRYLWDMLEEFRAYSGGRFHFEFLLSSIQVPVLFPQTYTTDEYLPLEPFPE